jgi:hypothetical protein
MQRALGGSGGQAQGEWKPVGLAAKIAKAEKSDVFCWIKNQMQIAATALKSSLSGALNPASLFPTRGFCKVRLSERRFVEQIGIIKAPQAGVISADPVLI